ncbi:MAG: methyltransferase domain-containing protein [Fimbriimonadaceae bacterium]|nr:methyltransferase domain-containing protein [Fimbriimonadaceae bacterium]
MALPPRVRLLDPRPLVESRAAPIMGAVNIPVEELGERVFELPPNSETVLVADVEPGAREAVAFLERGGREASRVPFALGPSQAGRLWEPNAFLMDCALGLTPGRALDLGCGVGRDAVALASLGWRVAAVDVLPEVAVRGRELEKRYGAGPPIEWLVADLEGIGDPRGLEGRRFDLVVSIRYLNRPLLARVGRWLNPGGRLIVETFTVENRRVHGRPRRDAHALQPGELAVLATELETLRYDEGWHDGYHTARLLARSAL